MHGQPSMEGIDMIISYIEQFFKVAVLKEVKEQSSRDRLQTQWIHFKTLLANVTNDPTSLLMYFDTLTSASKNQVTTKITAINTSSSQREENNNISRVSSSINRNEEQPLNSIEATKILEGIKRTEEIAYQEEFQKQQSQLSAVGGIKIDRTYPSSAQEFAQGSSKLPTESSQEQKFVNLPKTNPQQQPSVQLPEVAAEPFSFQRDKIKQNLGNILNLFKDNNTKIFNVKGPADRPIETENNTFNSVQRQILSKNGISNTLESNSLKSTTAVQSLGVTNNNNSNSRNQNIPPFQLTDTNSYQLPSLSAINNTNNINIHSNQKRHSLAAPASYFSYNNNISTGQYFPQNLPSSVNVPQTLHRNSSSSSMLTPIPPYVASSRPNFEHDQVSWNQTNNQYKNDNSFKVQNNDIYTTTGMSSPRTHSFLETKQQSQTAYVKATETFGN